MLVIVLIINLVPIKLKSIITMEPDFDINPIKGEILDYNEFSDEDETLKGKILDYQFFVTPKVEKIDVKPEIVKKELDADVKVLEYFENIIRNNYLRTLSKEEREKEKKPPNNKNKILYSCEHCDFKTYYKTNFETHTDVVHLKTIEYQCQQCDYKTYGKAYLHRHVATAHGNKKQKVFNCDLCGFSFTSLQNLRRHSGIHRDERKFSCDLCSYRARTKIALTSHRDRIHLKKQPPQDRIVSEICGKKFQMKLHYNVHLVEEHKVDIEVPTFICHTCGYKNNRRQTFIAHVLRHSNKTYLYCANCDYKTTIKNNLVQHMVKHMKNVKMHKCTICSFETKRPHTLRHHFKTHLK